MLNPAQVVRSFQSAPDSSRREALGISLLESIYPSIVGYVRGRVPLDECDDVVQEVMLSVLKSLPRFSGNTAPDFRNWCYRIAKCRIVDFYRSRERKPQTVSMEGLQEMQKELTAAGHFGVEERDLFEILRTLDPELFECIWARFFFDIDWKELASEFGVAEDALRMKVHRAFSKLRQILQESV